VGGHGAGFRQVGWRGRRWLWATGVAALIGLGVAPASAPSASAAASSTPTSSGPSLANVDGLKITSEQQLDPRLLAVTFSTAALSGPVRARILLPANYAANPSKRYPVLYLFDGTSGEASDWTNYGQAEQTTAGLNLIVVMPDITINGNGGGWCANSVNGGANGPPEWETFHIDELIPWVDQNFRTVAARDGRAIAGLSQGGFCSMSYAAQFPDLFITALAFSGAPDIAYDKVAQAGATAIINGTEVGFDQVLPDSIFGDPLTDEINWAAHDPATLANNLRGMNLFMYNGNGLPGPLDTSFNPEASFIEGLVGVDNQYFHTRLQSLGIPSYWDAYGKGTHSWPYWTRDLKQSIGPIMADFAHPPAPPSSVTYTSASASYSQFGWTVDLHRSAEEFSTLAQAQRSGFSLSGSGSAVVTTPDLYTPGTRYTVTMHGTHAKGTVTVTVTVSNAGQLALTVPLGPANPFQEDTAQDAATGGTKVYTTTVEISPA